MSVFLTNDELALFEKNGINGLQVKNTVDAYRAQGLSDDDIRAKIDAKLDGWYADIYGADKIANARAAVKEMQDRVGKDRWYKHLLDKDVLLGGAEGLLVGTERMLNGATLGAYDWANTLMGGGARERAAQMVQEAEEQGLGLPMKAGMLMADIGGSIKSPIFKALTRGAEMAGSKVLPKVTNKYVRSGINEALLGAGYGATRGAFESDFDPAHIAIGAAVGGATGGVVPMVRGGVGATARGLKSTVTSAKKGLERTKFIGGMFGRSPEEIAAGAQEISGALPDNGELTGAAVKNLTDDITKAVKAKATALYDKAEQLAAGGTVVLDKNSNFAKAFNKLAGDAPKSKRAELNKIWEEVGHNTYDAPTYKTAKSFRSWLSEKSAAGGTGLDKKEYGDLLEALDKDIEASLGKEAAAAKKAADAFYRNEMGNPNSVTSAVNKVLGRNKQGMESPVSVVGNRAVASAQGRAWKASSLKKILERGEEMGSPYVQDVKQGLQANTITRAQYNRMSAAQKQMVYGDKLPIAEKNFNGGVLNTLERAINNGIDKAVDPVQNILQALGKGRVPVATMSTTDTNAILKALQNK